MLLKLLRLLVSNMYKMLMLHLFHHAGHFLTLSQSSRVSSQSSLSKSQCTSIFGQTQQFNDTLFIWCQTTYFLDYTTNQLGTLGWCSSSAGWSNAGLLFMRCVYVFMYVCNMLYENSYMYDCMYCIVWILQSAFCAFITFRCV